MGMFDGLAEFGSMATLGLGAGILGGIGGVKGPSPSNWMPYLQEAKTLWGDARAQAMGQLQDSKDTTMGQFAPYLSQLQGMAQPYGEAGMAGMEGFQNLMANPGSITSDPFYQAKLAAGQGAIENSAAARGMQLSGTNLQDLGGFGANLAADTFGQRLAQFQQQNQMGTQGLFGGLQGMQNIAGIGMNFDQMLLNANYGGTGGQADALGAMAQANSAAAIGKMNAQQQSNSSLLGGLGTIAGGIGGFMLGGPMGAMAGASIGGSLGGGGGG